MTVFRITYDPSSAIKCKFEKNGKMLGVQSRFQSKADERLEDLFRSSENWDGLIDEIDNTCNSDHVLIKFVGSKADYEELKKAVSSYKGSTRIETSREDSEAEADVKHETEVRSAPVIKSSGSKKTEFSIYYNPYLVQCEFRLNGALLGPQSKFYAKKDDRLQTLLGTSLNWNGLIEEIAEVCGDKEITLHFKGRKIDFEDLKYSIDRYKGDSKFELSLEEIKSELDLIEKLDGIVKEIRRKNLPQFAKKNKNGKDIFEAYKEVNDGRFEVSVMATMSSGKSTLINSLLHTDILPSENEACTATIARIFDNDRMSGFEAECYGQDDETVIYPRDTLTAEKMREYNKDPRVKYINIEGDIPTISSSRIQLCLRDTPGPNNSQNEDHGRLTYSIIKRTNSVVLYVMNATQMEIKDDKNLLESIASEMRRAGKESRDRFIFVINKCDQLDEEKGETVNYYVDKARNYLKSFGIIDPIIIPTTARLALLIHKNMNAPDSLSRAERKILNDVDDFVLTPELHFEDSAILTPSVYDKLKAEVEKYHKNEDQWDYEALIHSGVPCVEETIAEYIDKYAYPMKIKDSVSDIIGVLDEINMCAEFDRRNMQDKAHLEMIRKQIKLAEEKHKNSKSVYEDYNRKISNFSLTEPKEKDEQFQLERELNALTREYDGKTQIQKNEAKRMVDGFQQKLIEFQRNCETRINREIDEKMYGKCQAMLADYQRLIMGIIEGIQIEGFDFNKISSFRDIRISNIDSIIKANEEEKSHKETRYKDNPERSGFFGKFKFWKPKQVSYEVDVSDGMFVNVKNVIVDVMGEFKLEMKRNISDTFRKAEKQIEDYKNAFKRNIEALDGEIMRILKQLKDDTAEMDKIEERVRRNQTMADWANEMDKQIRSILSF